MKRMAWMAWTALILAGLFSGCMTAPSSGNTLSLRVGVTPDYPPFAYKQGETIQGVEADLARELGLALNRPVQFVELAWDDLIPALVDRRIDIIMSGMSVNEARKVRIAFTDAYMSNNLVAAIERQDIGRFKTRQDVIDASEGTGFVKGSSADTFVTTFMKKAQHEPLKKIADAAFLFDANRIRLFIGDLCAVAQLISENESALAGVWIPLQDESMAWGVRMDDAALKESINRVLAGWQQDGTVQKILSARAPYLDRIPWKKP